MLRIDEAIAHERDVSKKIYVEAMLCHANPDDGKLDDCIESGKYHEQIAEWLEELKRRREYDGEIIGSGALNNAYNQGYNKAIDDFIHECDRHCGFYNGYNKNLTREDILMIAEQLKEGVTNETN